MLAGALLLVMASCKAPKTLTTVEKLRPVGAGKLIRNIEENTYNYAGLDIKRIACQYETPDSKTTFRASLKSVKDDHILISFSKLNIPVGRLLLTPDSVKMINYIDRTYFTANYAYLERFISATLDFNVVQAILANDVFSFRDDQRENDFRDYVSYADSGMYVLQSFKNRKLDKISRKGKEEKIDRYLKKTDEDDFIVESVYIDPNTYKVRLLILDDVMNERKLQVRFDEFERVEGQLYPGSIDVHLTSPENNLKMKVKLSKFSTEINPEINFSIPEKYSRIN